MKELEKKRQYTNGVEIKPIRNRAVSVVKLNHRDGVESVGLTFKKGDVPVEERGVPCVKSESKLSAEFTRIAISRESALALYICLHDYFERVDPDFLKS